MRRRLTALLKPIPSQLEAESKRDYAQWIDAHEITMERKNYINGLTNKVYTLEGKFRGIDEPKMALKKAVDEMYKGLYPVPEHALSSVPTP